MSASRPAADLAEGKRFYGDVLGGDLRVDTPTFASFKIAGADVGIGIEGCSISGRAPNIRISPSSSALTS